MTTILLKSAGKKFLNQWIFRNLNLQVYKQEKIAITGYNGSGKSTLIQIISGFQSLTEGSVQYYDQNSEIAVENWYQKISFAAPYLDVHEEYNLHELISFYSAFKPFQTSLEQNDLIRIMNLEESQYKAIKYYSSGMKQRIRLALAVFSDAPVLLLDEPVSNLDKIGIAWYQHLLLKYAKEKTIIICSNNIEDEISLCDRKIDMNEFKL